MNEMSKKTGKLPALFVALMLLFCLFLAVLTPVHESLHFRLTDTAASLKTSQGREAKQEHEYNLVMIRLPAARLLLGSVQPLTALEEQKAEDLKQTRNTLRKKKKNLESQAGESSETQQEAGDADEP